MPDFILPVGAVRVSPNGTWLGHQRRTPPSVNPGTDYECAMNTPVRAAAAGLVTLAQSTFAGSGGRMVYIKSTVANKLSEVQYLHLNRVDVREGQQVAQGQVIAMSGASGFGKNNGYGPHCHVTLRIQGRNVDFQQYASGASPASLNTEEIDDMGATEQLALKNIEDKVGGYGRRTENIETVVSQLVDLVKGYGGRIEDIQGRVIALPRDTSVELTEKTILWLGDQPAPYRAVLEQAARNAGATGPVVIDQAALQAALTSTVLESLREVLGADLPDDIAEKTADVLARRLAGA
jgi:hypothetical protein